MGSETTLFHLPVGIFYEFVHSRRGSGTTFSIYQLGSFTKVGPRFVSYRARRASNMVYFFVARFVSCRSRLASSMVSKMLSKMIAGGSSPGRSLSASQ